MRVYKLMIVIFYFFNLTYCKEKNNIAPIIYLFWSEYYLPSEEIKRQCAQPNAIPWGNISSSFVSGGCINTKAANGLIFDVDTNQNITADTLISGKSFKCLCNGKIATDGYTWLRSKQLFDFIPQPPPELELLFFYSPSDSKGKNEALTNSTYKTTDNLFCITQCNIGQGSTQYQYQFLKIRSSL